MRVLETRFDARGILLILPGFNLQMQLEGKLTMRNLDELIYEIILHPIDAIFAIKGFHIFYVMIQLIALFIAYVFWKRGIVVFGFPVLHYILALVIAHLIYSITLAFMLANSEFLL